MKIEVNLLYPQTPVTMAFSGSEEYMKYISEQLWLLILNPKASRIPKHEPENFFELLEKEEINFNEFECICISGQTLLAYKVSAI